MDFKKFYDTIRGTITLTDQNVKGFDFILNFAEKQDKTALWDLAYILATTFHETAHTMQPIAEYGKGKGRKYGVKGKYGQVPYGRGYVQLTWDYNYEKADKELKLNGALLKDFDLAMKPEIAVHILFTGMKKGWFTGKSLKDFIDNIDEDDKEDQREFANARRIINGTDKQILISQYALIFEKALKAAEYGLEATQKPVEESKPQVSTPEPKTTNVVVRPSKSIVEAIVEFIKILLGAKR